jgi:Brp/Blh family beta-carotene 15,15'-monooxygenase
MHNSSYRSLHTLIDKALFATGLLFLVIHSFYPINFKTQVFIFLSTILLAGIPHGALDHLVEKKNKHIDNHIFSWLSFLSGYFFQMIIFGIIWFFYPMIALIIFIGLSALHFGETDLRKVNGQAGPAVSYMQFCYGIFILLILLLSHFEEVKLILIQFPELQNSDYLDFINRFSKELIFGSAIIAASGIFIYFLKTGHDSQDLISFSSFVKMILILLLLIKLPLMISFAFYFGLWHSLHSLENIRYHLSQKEDQQLSWIVLIGKSIPLTIAALAFIGLIMYLMRFNENTPSFILQIFIGIAILTAPHLQVMGKMYQKISLSSLQAKNKA